MSLKTNSKKASENIRAWIEENFDEEYNGAPAETFKEKAVAILKELVRVEGYEHKRGYSWERCFHEWAPTLPGILNTADYEYTRTPYDVLAEILEQDDATKEKYEKKYSYTDAEHTLNYLIFRELCKVAGAETLH